MGNKRKLGTRNKCYKKKVIVRKCEPTTPRPRTKPRPSQCQTSADSKPTSSNRKLKVSGNKLYYDNLNESMEYDIVDLDKICNMIFEIAVCKNCSHKLTYEKVRLEGLAFKIKVLCPNCDVSEVIENCPKSEEVNLGLDDAKTCYDLNLRLVHGLRSIGKGQTAARMLLGCMNLPPPPKLYRKHETRLSRATELQCQESMKRAAEEAIASNESPDLTVAVDGSWQKRGHTSLNGILSVTSMDNSKVLDVAIMSKFCLCPRREENMHEPSCKANYLGTSGGMEVHGALEIFRRSEALYGARYVNFLGDGDSKAFDSVREAKVYGEVEVNKLECVGHVQKRLGKRLMKLKSKSGKVVLEDGKKVGGKGRLSQPNILRLQTYYGLAIRRNTHSVDAMKRAIWASYFHTLSTNENPRHQLCPKDKDTWCKYNLAQLTHSKEPYDHTKHFHMPECVMNFIKPMYRDLSDTKLLQRCLKGKTQNQNESLNSVIWSVIPKRSFVTLPTLKYGVYTAICTFNDGFRSKVELFEKLGLHPGKNLVDAMKKLENERLREAERKHEELLKKIRNKRSLKRKLLEELFESNEDPDRPSYSRGEY